MSKVWHNVIFYKLLTFVGSPGLVVMGEARELYLVVVEGFHLQDLISISNKYYNYIYNRLQSYLSIYSLTL